MKVLFNADDFGLTKGVTDGIIQAHSQGVIGSTTLMMNGNAVEYAVKQAQKHHLLKVGLHLVLTTGYPISSNVPNLINRNGKFKFTSTSCHDFIDINQVEKEWRAQIELFLKNGLQLHHLDSHHHVHGWPSLKEIVIKLASEYSVPVRFVHSLKHYKNILLTESLYDNFYGDGVDDNIFSKLKELDARSVEVMTHPAIVDQELQNASSYTMKRKRELEILCSLTKPEWVELLPHCK